MILFWIFVFCVTLALLVKGADIFLEKAEKIGLAMKVSPFIIGVAIVGFGTSLPELVSSVAGVIQGAPEIVVANVVGSNVANILLIIGVSALVARRLTVKKDVIDLDLPLLGLSSILFLVVAYDGVITIPESALLFVAYLMYLWYIFTERGDEEGSEEKIQHHNATKGDYALLVFGLVLLVVSAKYLIDAVIALATALDVATGIIAITAVAVGTSLPELMVSIKAAFQKKTDVVFGNIIGSNIFNALSIVAIPGIFTQLPMDEKTLTVGLAGFAITTLLFVISGISRRIHAWEGAFFLVLYVLFTAKVTNLF